MWGVGLCQNRTDRTFFLQKRELIELNELIVFLTKKK